MPSSYRAGVIQQPYTKYESDNDEIKLEYRRMDSGERLSWLNGYKGSVVRVLILAVIFLFGLILGYVMRRSSRQTNAGKASRNSTPGSSSETYGFDLTKELLGFVNADSIQQNLRSYTSEVHISGTGNNNHLAYYLHFQMRQLHLAVKEVKYKVLLSYHDWVRPNTVYLLNANGSVEYQTEYKGPAINGDPRAADHPEITQSFMAYSANGSVQGELVYANFGEEKDFLLLQERSISCKNKIAIMRVGRIFPGHVVRRAEDCGAIGVILYPDPSEFVLENDEDADFSNSETDATFPKSRSLPGWASVRATLWRYGDPLTPGLPSKDGVYRLPIGHVSLLPSIPVVPVSYDDANRLMSRNMKGPVERDRFSGSMKGNVTYGMGPGYASPWDEWRVKLDVFTDLETREITNVVGILRGTEEPDHYVIIGCHYDAWTYGGVDPNSGTAILIEISKAFDMLLAKGWQPKRTIVFAHWDAGEMGQIGSYEWVEEFASELSGRTVAYVNIDEAVSGNFLLDVECSPILRTLLINASKRVPMNDANNYESLYDFWIDRLPTQPENSNPAFSDPSTDSDHVSFLYNLGVPIVWPRFTNRRSANGRAPSFPAHHTVIDGYEYVQKFVDASFETHSILARLVAEVVLQLSTNTRLPLDVREFAQSLRLEIDAMVTGKFKDFGRLLDHLQWAVQNFTQRADVFHVHFQRQESTSLRGASLYNERLLRLSSAFLIPDLYKEKPSIARKSLFGPSITDSSSPHSVFTGIYDALESYTRAMDEETQRITFATVEQEISLATLAIQSATRLLIMGDNFP